MLVTLDGISMLVTLAVLRTEFPISAVNSHDYSVFTITLILRYKLFYDIVHLAYNDYKTIQSKK